MQSASRVGSAKDVLLSSGVRSPRYRLWAYRSPRETASCKAAVIKVVPRIGLFVLEIYKNLKDFFIDKDLISEILCSFEMNFMKEVQLWIRSESVMLR